MNLMNLMNWLIPEKTCPEGGRHNFETFVMKETPPSAELIDAANADCMTAGDCIAVIKSLTAKECIVCCTWCGKKAE